MERRDDQRDADSTAAWAILKTGGKQYRVRAGDRLDVARSAYIAATVPNTDGRRLFAFDEILMVRSDGGETLVGTPNVPNARVVAELLPERKSRKIIAFKKRRRQNSRRRRGHREILQPVVVVAVECGGPLTVDDLVPKFASSRPVDELSPWPDSLSQLLTGLTDEAPDHALASLIHPRSSAMLNDAPTWVRKELAKAVEPSLTGGDGRRRWIAALALAAVTGDLAGGAMAPDAVAGALERHFARTGRRHFLEVELRPTEPTNGSPGTVGLYRATVRLKSILNLPVGNVTARLTRGIPTGVTLQTQIFGPGVDPGKVHIVMRHERPAGVLREWVADFTNDSGAGDYAVLDVVLDGRRVERRFLNLDRLTVLRKPLIRHMADEKNGLS